MIEIRVVLDVSDGLRALVAALLGAVETRRVGGASPPEHGAPGPSPAAVAGASPPPAPSVPLPSPAVAKVRAGKPAAADWRTPERKAVMLAKWSGNYSLLTAALAAVPGPPMPASPSGVLQWGKVLGLGPRPKLLRPDAGRARGAPVPPVAAVPPPVPASQPAPGGGAGVAVVDGVAWGEILAWADTVDPDLVLRGTPEARLAQINELRRLEGLPVYRMPPPPARAPAAAVQVAA